MSVVPISVVIPTCGRERVLLDTVEALLALEPGPQEIILVDQTETHAPETDTRLRELAAAGDRVQWLRETPPSIPRAMNRGALQARAPRVLFLDDDIVPSPSLVAAHFKTAEETGAELVVGQVLQPGEEPLSQQESPWVDGRDNDPDAFRFNASDRHRVRRVMAGNLSVLREAFVALGGFDENFIGAAYRFEAEFAERAVRGGYKIIFEPGAGIRHLKAASGGTRRYGTHLTTWRPDHAVGRYYYALRLATPANALRELVTGPFAAVATRHHLRKPWWIPVTLFAEIAGVLLALRYRFQGARLISDSDRMRASGAAG